MIFLVQFGINKHSQIFQRLQIALALRARAIFCNKRERTDIKTTAES